MGSGFVDPGAPSDWWPHDKPGPAARYTITSTHLNAAYMVVPDRACNALCTSFSGCTVVTQNPNILPERHHVGVFCSCSGTTSDTLTAFP